MRHLLRKGVTALALVASIELASAPARAAPSVTVQANIAKPLTLTWIQNLDLGTIVLGPGTWSNATVAISRAGVFSCANANIPFTGAAQVAIYNVSGTNNQTVRISAPNVVLTNQDDRTSTLTLVVDGPSSLVLTNSGQPGTDFPFGGSIVLSSSTPGGTYSGTFNVTVDY